MPRTDLTDARVRALKPRKVAYDIRDGKLRGFGLRVLPSGAKRFFVHCQHRGERVWKTIGDTTSMDVRLHDLRHTVASHAVMNGVPVPVVSRLLGHSNVRMTLRYAHLGDRDIERAAERVGQAIARRMEP